MSKTNNEPMQPETQMGQCDDWGLFQDRRLPYLLRRKRAVCQHALYPGQAGKMEGCLLAGDGGFPQAA